MTISITNRYHRILAAVALGLTLVVGLVSLAPSALATETTETTDGATVEYHDEDGNVVEPITPGPGDIDRSDLVRDGADSDQVEYIDEEGDPVEPIVPIEDQVPNELAREATAGRWWRILLAAAIGSALGVFIGRLIAQSRRRKSTAISFDQP